MRVVRVVVIVVGRAKDSPLGAAAQDYERRAARYWPLSVAEVRGESAGTRTVDLALEREGERILDRVPVRAALVACAVGGTSLTSTDFAVWMQRARESGRDLAIAIGGAFGLGPAVLKAASMKLSLAPFTLPHELARVVLAEQIYRAGTIVRGEPYHK